MKKAAEAAPEAKKSKSGIRRDKLQHDYWRRLMFWRMINGKIENSISAADSKKRFYGQQATA